MLISDAPTGRIELFSHGVPETVVDQCLAELVTSLRWQQHQVRLFGELLDCPRLSAWHADPGLCYRYSGVEHQPGPWIPPLLGIRDCLRSLCTAQFNSVLANRYRHGSDHIGWHADDEPELGSSPVIASVSLGATRRFHLRRRGAGSIRKCVDLQHGDVLIMSGLTQRFWQHRLAPTRRVVGERISLTFRNISYQAK